MSQGTPDLPANGNLLAALGSRHAGWSVPEQPRRDPEPDG
ncbi:MAG: hypothetical protein JWO98_3984 [Frankiales bacterium]|nr:hypothetical protein [Frankiales bacterium]